MRPLLTFVVALLLVSAGCGEAQDEEAAPGADFLIAGTVGDVRPGLEPDDVPDPGTDTDVDPEAGRESAEIEPGALVVETSAETAGCELGDDGYTVYYDEGTAFDPVDTTDDDDFPDSLKGQEVSVAGTVFPQGNGCTFVAESITVTKAASSPDATRTPGPRPNEIGTPQANP